MTDKLGPYELVRLIGRGGMDEVHLARDTRLEREVARKLLPPDLVDDPDRRAQRRKLAQGYYADVVLFDPATITDHATFDDPHQLATGGRDVFVNGVAVLRDGEPTGETPGQVVRGPGWTGWPRGVSR